MIQQSHSWGYIFGKNKRYMHPNAHRSTVDNSQDIKTVQVPINDKWLKKLWYTCTMKEGVAYVHESVRELRLSVWFWYKQNGREEGGGFRMGNTCIPVADSF